MTTGKGKHVKDKDQIKYMKIRNDELEFLDDKELLGQGQFGDVCRAKWNGEVVAVKRFQSADAKCGFWDELFYLVRLKHENIVKLYGAFPDKKKPYIVMEYAHNSLAKVLHGAKLQYEYNVHHVVFWSLQLLLGLQYIHLCNLIHRDVKSSNVLLFGVGHQLKLCDFGTATKIEHTLTNGVGTVRYMAPEVIKGKNYSKQVDIFSFAVVFWEMLSRKIPLLQANGEGEENHFSLLYAIAKGARPPPIKGIPKLFSTMIERCWDEAPDKRPSTDELVKKFTNLSKHFNAQESLLRRNVYGKHVSYDPAKVKHLSSLTSHSQPFASLVSGTQVKKVPTQVENPSYQSPANSAASNTGDKDDEASKVKSKMADEAIEDVTKKTSNMQIAPTSGDDKSNDDKSSDVMSSEEQPATLTAGEAKATPAPGPPTQSQPNEVGLASPSKTSTLHTNADKTMDHESHHRAHPPLQHQSMSASAVLQTNADISQPLSPGGPRSAPPHKHAAMGKQFSSPLPNIPNIPSSVPEEAANEKPTVFSQFSETPLKGTYQSQISYADLPQYVNSEKKVSVEEHEIMQRQQLRFKKIEEREKSKPPQALETYKDPYTYKSGERMQAKQKRSQGSYSYRKAQPGSKHHITELDDAELQPIVPVEDNKESEVVYHQYKESAHKLVTARQEFTEVQLRLQSLDEQVEQHEKYKALVDKADHLMKEHARLKKELDKLNSDAN